MLDDFARDWRILEEGGVKLKEMALKKSDQSRSSSNLCSTDSNVFMNLLCLSSPNRNWPQLAGFRAFKVP